MSKAITDGAFLYATQIKQAHKDRRTILTSYGSFHKKLVSLFEPRMVEFKERFTKVTDIKAARLEYNAEMRKDEAFEDLYSDKNNASLRAAISHAWRIVQGGKAPRRPAKGDVDTIGTVADMKKEVSPGEFFEIAVLMHMALSPKQVKGFDAKEEALYAKAEKAAAK